ncbi:hypothetical protein, partial [Streptacidiphilus anmyonensis]|uniref:hypothetical protein n=1 Tax=Streptacidiphilus anmyonensis TaxID=405782 RepID=UPI0005AB6DDD
GPQASDVADSPRFYALFDLPLIAEYCSAFPVGSALARRLLFRSRRRLVRESTAILAGLLILSGVLAGDLAYNVAPPHGDYLSARCSHGRPPWWPQPLPLRDSPYADFEHAG